MVVSLSQQVQVLIDQAPPDLQQPIAQMAPILQQIAGDLGHQFYFIGQGLNQEWIVITLENRQKVQMRSVYAFGRAADAQQFFDPQDLIEEIPIIALLFQLLALDTIDQLILFDQPGNLTAGRTVSRADVQKAVQIQLSNTIPSDLC